MFPAASRQFDRVISLPIYPDMNDVAVDRVIDVVIDVLSRFQR
jgi:dTDP-4-amino-4,6-dideoxygalactose transaminase